EVEQVTLDRASSRERVVLHHVFAVACELPERGLEPPRHDLRALLYAVARLLAEMDPVDRLEVRSDPLLGHGYAVRTVAALGPPLRIRVSKGGAAEAPRPEICRDPAAAVEQPDIMGP